MAKKKQNPPLKLSEPRSFIFRPGRKQCEKKRRRQPHVVYSTVSRDGKNLLQNAGILEGVVEDGLFYRGKNKADVGGVGRLSQATPLSASKHVGDQIQCMQGEIHTGGISEDGRG